MSGSSARYSQRRRSEPAKFEACATTGVWTVEERLELLAGMKKYGVLDINSLHQLVPTKTPDRIRQYIFEQAKNARHLRERRIIQKHKEAKKNGSVARNASVFGPLDMWLRKMKGLMPTNYDEARTVSLTRVVQFIAFFEKQPSPEKCGGIDFRAMYEFLFYMMSGLPGKEVDPITSKYMLHCMAKFAVMLRKRNEDYYEFLRKYREPIFPSDNSEFTIAKCTESTSSKTSMEEILKIPGFNPFNVPSKFLLKALK